MSVSSRTIEQAETEEKVLFKQHRMYDDKEEEG